MEILRVENLSFRYPNGEGESDFALSDINFSVSRGEFIVLCGVSGCGKTTLLRLIKKECAPAGEKSGRIFYNGEPLEDTENAGEIGFVGQNPEHGIVTDKVWHELAFGLENMGLPTDAIRRRVGETASFFGIQSIFRKKTDELSGGQKQLLNLASVMVMGPKLLLLDEPTSRLDPIAAADFISTLQKLNRETGLSIILSEHRLEEVLPTADRVILMENGKILICDAPRKIGERLAEENSRHPMMRAMPSAVRIYRGLDMSGESPLTVREGRDFLLNNFSGAARSDKDFCGGEAKEIKEAKEAKEIKEAKEKESERTAENKKSRRDLGVLAAEMKNVWFRYGRALPDVLRGVSFDVRRGEAFCILGGNGVGKTTALNVLAGLDRAYRGSVSVNGKRISEYKGASLYRENLAYLPQDTSALFVKDTVIEDLCEIFSMAGVKKSDREALAAELAKKAGLSHLLRRHPYDVSGGEMQRLALCKVLISKPKILLLDEPTIGLDAFSKDELSNIIKRLKSDGVAVLAVTHDAEFAAECADRCALFFDGEILSVAEPSLFFSENNFYTTAANRIARDIWKDAVTCGEVVRRCKEYCGS